MKFNDLLNIYLYELELCIAREKHYNKSEWDSKYALYNFFENIKYKCDDYYEITKPRNPYEEEKELFRYTDEFGTTYEVDSIIDYIGAKLPVYLDDYGQCFFTVIDGKNYSMGAFNSDLSDVCDIYDYELLEKTRI